MKVADNCFDFNVRDRLQKECSERNWTLRSDSAEHNNVMIDMITYCSRGNKEEAVLNLRTSMEFKDGLISTGLTLGLDMNIDMESIETDSLEVVGEAFLFFFWRRSFIELKVSVHKNENIPRKSYHESIMRDFGRFLNAQNFNDSDVFQEEVDVAIHYLHVTAGNFNNLFKELMKEDEENK